MLYVSFKTYQNVVGDDDSWFRPTQTVQFGCGFNHPETVGFRTFWYITSMNFPPLGLFDLKLPMKWGKKPGCFKLTNAFCVLKFQPSYLSWGCGSYDKKWRMTCPVWLFSAGAFRSTIGAHLPPGKSFTWVRISVRLQNLHRKHTREQVWANLERQPPTRGTQETTAYFETRNSLAHADCFALGSLFALPAVPPTLERGWRWFEGKECHSRTFIRKQTNLRDTGGICL